MDVRFGKSFTCYEPGPGARFTDGSSVVGDLLVGADGTWSAPNVTLLGDAVHTMSPGRGAGANIALRDAATLLRHLCHASASLSDALWAYEAEMLEYGFQAVAASRDNPFFAGRKSARMP